MLPDLAVKAVPGSNLVHAGNNRTPRFSNPASDVPAIVFAKFQNRVRIVAVVNQSENRFGFPVHQLGYALAGHIRSPAVRRFNGVINLYVH